MTDNHLRIGKDNTDPLLDAPEAGKVLFDRINHACRDFPVEAVVNAAGSLLLNVIRQRNGTRAEAEKDFNDMFGRLKAMLMQHYDGTNGRRRSVFPFHQDISVPYLGKLKARH